MVGTILSEPYTMKNAREVGNIAPFPKDTSYISIIFLHSITFLCSSIAVASFQVHLTIHVLYMLVESYLNISYILTKFDLAASHLQIRVIAIESMNTNCEHHQK